MSNNYNRGSLNLGYGPNLGQNPNKNVNPPPPNNPYSMFGYGDNSNSNNFNNNVNPQNIPGSLGQNQSSLWNSPQVKTEINQFQNNPPYQPTQLSQPSVQLNQTPVQWGQPSTRLSQESTINPYNQQNLYNQPIPYSQPNPYNQPNTYNQPPPNIYRENIQYPSLQQSQGSKNVLSNLIRKETINNLNQQMNNLNVNKQTKEQEGMNIWADLLTKIDWDALLKKKNVAKKQSDTSWVTYQEQSWLQSQPSHNVQIETEIKFAFPNPYIKYKIIPGVDQKMALDVTAKDDFDKGLARGNLIIWDYHGGPNQQFYIHRCPKSNNQQGYNLPQKSRINDQEFILINASNGFVVSAIKFTVNSSIKKQNPNHLYVFPKMDDIRSQRWRLNPVSQKGDIFMIQSVETGKVLDVEGASRSNGASVLQWESNRQKNQLWKILPA